MEPLPERVEVQDRRHVGAAAVDRGHARQARADAERMRGEAAALVAAAELRGIELDVRAEKLTAREAAAEAMAADAAQAKADAEAAQQAADDTRERLERMIAAAGQEE